MRIRTRALARHSNQSYERLIDRGVPQERYTNFHSWEFLPDFLSGFVVSHRLLESKRYAHTSAHSAIARISRTLHPPEERQGLHLPLNDPHSWRLNIMQPSTTPTDLAHIATMTNLQAAWRAVRRKRGEAGLDGITLQEFQNALETRLQRIQQALQAHTYRPEALRHVVLSKRDGGQRHIGVPTVADRVVQHAILNVLEPCFEPTFCDCSYGYRPGRSAHQAVRAIMQGLEAGCRWVVEADLEDFSIRSIGLCCARHWQRTLWTSTSLL